MLKETLLQTIGVIIGAIIGALISWKIAGSFWWIGALIGGSISYFLGEFQRIKEGLRIAFTGYNLKKRFLVGMGTGFIFNSSRRPVSVYVTFSQSKTN